MGDRGTELFYQQQARQAMMAQQAAQKAQAFARAGIPTPSNYAPGAVQSSQLPAQDNSINDAINAMLGEQSSEPNIGDLVDPHADDITPDSPMYGKTAGDMRKALTTEKAAKGTANTQSQPSNPKGKALNSTSLAKGQAGSTPKFAKGQATSMDDALASIMGDVPTSANAQLQTAMPEAAEGTVDPNDFMAALHSSGQPQSQSNDPGIGKALLLAGAGAAGLGGAGAIANAHMQTARGNQPAPKGPQTMQPGDLGAVPQSNDAYFDQKLNSLMGETPQVMQSGDVNGTTMSPQDMEMTGTGQQLDQFAHRTMGPNAASRDVRAIAREVQANPGVAADAMSRLRAMASEPGAADLLKLLGKVFR